jgi:hypothetical protein
VLREVATAARILGIFADRWLFFIDAEQAVVLSKREWRWGTASIDAGAQTNRGKWVCRRVLTITNSGEIF